MIGGIINTSKGRLTETATGFGRHYSVFQALEQKLKQIKKKSLKSLVIGPGLEPSFLGPFSKEITKTYQPYELANTFHRSGFNNYTIDVMDINQKVLDEMKKSPTILKIHSNFWERNHKTIRESKKEKENSKKYFDDFFMNSITKKQINPITKKEEMYRLVQIPEYVTKNIKLKLGDLITDKIPKKHYNVVVCTVLLSHYLPEMTHDFFNPIPKVLNKLLDSVKFKGYFIDSYPWVDQRAWKIIEICEGDYATIHDTSATLSYRKQTNLSKLTIN